MTSTTTLLPFQPSNMTPAQRRDVYRMVARIAKAAGIPRHISPHSLRLTAYVAGV